MVEGPEFKVIGIVFIITSLLSFICFIIEPFRGYSTKINMERMGELRSLETWATGTQIPRSILLTNLKELQVYTNSLTEESRDVIAELEKRGCQYRIEPPSEAPR